MLKTITENRTLQIDTTDPKRLEETLRETFVLLSKKDRYNTIITGVIRTIHQSLSLQDVLENAVKALKQNIDNIYSTGIYLVEGETAVLRAHQDVPDSYIERAGRIPYPKGYTWKTILEGKPIYCADIEQDTVIGAAGRDMGIKSYLGMPIHYEGKTVGAIGINSLKKNAFDEEELKLLETIAQQIEIAFRNAKQLEALRKAQDQLETRVKERTNELANANELLQCEIAERRKVEEVLRKNIDQLSKKNRYETIISTVARSVHRSINLQEVMENAAEAMSKNIDRADSLTIYLVEGQEAVLKTRRGLPDWYVKRAGRIPYGRGITWKTIIEEKPRYCPDVDQEMVIGPAGRELGTKSYASMPICFSGKTIGALNISSFQKNAFGEEELKLLEKIALQIEMAINNAQTAEELRRSEERYRTLFEQSPVGVYIFDRDFNIIECNGRFAQILHSSHDKIIGIDIKKLRNQCVLPLIERVLQGESAHYEGLYEATHSRAKLWVSVRLSPLRDSNGNVTGGMSVVEDITERKRAEEALRHSEERYRDLYENNPLMCFTVDTEGKILAVNLFGAQQLGYTARELTGRSVFDIFHKEDKERVRESLNACLQSPQQVAEWEFRKIHKDGRTLWVKETARSIQDVSGNTVILVICQDITRHIEIQKELLQKEKLASLGEMAARVAHEIRNPLGGVKMSFNLIRRNLSEDCSDISGNILSGIRHIENIINELLDFTRETTLKKKDYDISRIIINVVDSLSHEIAEKQIRLVYKRFDPGIWASVDGLKISQAFTNILKNAIEAIDHGHGKIRVNLYNDGSSLHVEFVDNGVGISKENCEKIFNPFFTTKANGTGLGMAIVKRIVSLHNGDIGVRSIPGAGTKVRINLPNGVSPYEKKHSSS